MTKRIAEFFDEHGRLTTMPSKRRPAHQMAVLEHLAELFENSRPYTQAEVDSVLRDHTVLEDVAQLRHELVEGEYLACTPDQQTYWRANGRVVLPAQAE